MTSQSLKKNNSIADGSSNTSSDSSLNMDYEYQRPRFSSSFLKHMEQVKSSFPDNIRNEGVDCVGEPSIDPSRMVMDDGLDSEYLNDF